MRFDDRTADLGDLIDESLRVFGNEIHTCMPGYIAEWDSSTQLAGVQPLISRSFRTIDGETIFEPYPVIPGVPVVFPRTASVAITMPVAIGDRCILVFTECSMDQYLALAKTDEVVDDPIERRHSVDDAFALLGGWPDQSKLPSFDSSNIVLGTIGGATEYVALADKAKIELDKLRTFLNALNTIISGPPIPEPGSGSNSAFQTALAAAVVTAGGLPTIVAPASDKVKATKT